MEHDEEVWLDIDEAPRYVVSNYGRVMNKRIGRVLNGGNKSYAFVNLNTETGQITRSIHYLVMRAFVGPKPPGYEINHIDLNTRNNMLSNLKYVTHLENMRHASENFAWGRVLNPIQKRILIVETGEIYDTLEEAADAVGGNEYSIKQVLSGQLRRHRNYHFEYVD